MSLDSPVVLRFVICNSFTGARVPEDAAFVKWQRDSVPHFARRGARAEWTFTNSPATFARAIVSSPPPDSTLLTTNVVLCHEHANIRRKLVAYVRKSGGTLVLAGNFARKVLTPGVDLNHFFSDEWDLPWRVAKSVSRGIRAVNLGFQLQAPPPSQEWLILDPFERQEYDVDGVWIRGVTRRSHLIRKHIFFDQRAYGSCPADLASAAWQRVGEGELAFFGDLRIMGGTSMWMNMVFSRLVSWQDDAGWVSPDDSDTDQEETSDEDDAKPISSTMANELRPWPSRFAPEAPDDATSAHQSMLTLPSRAPNPPAPSENRTGYRVVAFQTVQAQLSAGGPIASYALGLNNDLPEWFIVASTPSSTFDIRCISLPLINTPKTISAGNTRCSFRLDPHAEELCGPFLRQLQTENIGQIVALDEDAMGFVILNLEDSRRMHWCYGCGKWEVRGQTPFLRCARCKRRRYCSKDCQITHWINGHKTRCSRLPQTEFDDRVPDVSVCA